MGLDLVAMVVDRWFAAEPLFLLAPVGRVDVPGDSAPIVAGITDGCTPAQSRGGGTAGYIRLIEARYLPRRVDRSRPGKPGTTSSSRWK